jgi:nitroreductase
MIHYTEYNTPITELIRKRYSCRTYLIEPLREDVLGPLMAFAERCQIGRFGTQIRFEVAASQEGDTGSLKNLGTYGFIKNPAGFVIGALKDQPFALEDFGYQMELIILRAADLGIGTCWLGGTYTKSRFAKLIRLQDQETIPSVVSIGYPADHQAWMDRMSRNYADADSRLSWQVLFSGDTFGNPLTPHQAGEYREPLELVRLAPSASNKQPWRILRRNNLWHFYLQRTKNYPSPLADLILGLADLQRIDLGIAMAHFELGAQALNLNGEWVREDPELPSTNPSLVYTQSWKST